ncbi:MAG TPA: choice-of-anchor tandem repeat GloVer-containing protein [Rhizomicrobium sp.]
MCCGTVYRLSPGNNGNWKYRVIYRFRGPVSDGEAPYGGVIADSAGNLFGTALQRGTGLECGIVYELSPDGKGNWKEAVLHEFDHSSKGSHRDGCTPSSYLVFDASGNLFGTTSAGGGVDKNGACENDYYCGTVFELSRKDGKWTEAIIHRFPETAEDGTEPMSGLVFDHAGNLWGTTFGGGQAGGGTVFELKPTANGKWKESSLFSFSDSETGTQPYGGLVVDASGNFYGTTFAGGLGAGTVFELTSGRGGRLTESLVHQFASCNQAECPDGLDPFGGLTIDSAGNLYGTATQGGEAGTFCNGGGNIKVGCGVMFELSPAGIN